MHYMVTGATSTVPALWHLWNYDTSGTAAVNSVYLPILPVPAEELVLQNRAERRRYA